MIATVDALKFGDSRHRSHWLRATTRMSSKARLIGCCRQTQLLRAIHIEHYACRTGQKVLFTVDCQLQDFICSALPLTKTRKIPKLYDRAQLARLSSAPARHSVILLLLEPRNLQYVFSGSKKHTIITCPLSYASPSLCQEILRQAGEHFCLLLVFIDAEPHYGR